MLGDRNACEPLRPSLRLRFRVLMSTWFPGREDGQRWDARERIFSGSYNFATTVILFFFLIFVAIGALSLTMNTIETDKDKGGALTAMKEKTARLSLAVANRRLTELDEMLTTGSLRPEDVKAVISDYNSRATVVAEIISNEDTGKSTAEIASEYYETINREKLIEKKLVASGIASGFETVTGVPVQVSSWTGGPGHAASKIVGTRTDGNGKIRFGTPGTSISSISDYSNLDLHVEYGETKAVLPIFPNARDGATPLNTGGTGAEPVELPLTPASSDPSPATGADGYRIASSCSGELLPVGAATYCTVTVTDNKGRPAANSRLRLEDLTGTSSICGAGNVAEVTTDAVGMATFRLEKLSIEHSTRLTATVLADQYENDIGLFAVIGGIDGPAERRLFITTVPTEDRLSEGARRIEVTVFKTAAGLFERPEATVLPKP